MRINATRAIPIPYTVQNIAAARPPRTENVSPVSGGRSAAGSNSAVVVDISPKTWSAYMRNKTQAAEGSMVSALRETQKPCETCESRSYKDKSDDPSVSFQSAASLTPNQTLPLVAAHEQEHVSNEQLQAEKEGRKIISQSVTLKTSICPECERVYIAGGVTRTVSAPDKNA